MSGGSAKPAIDTLQPDLGDVKARLSDGYVEPERLTVKAAAVEVPREDLVIWERSYDGVPLVDRPKSVRVKGVWQLRRVRELEPPQAVRREALISDARAVAVAGVGAGSDVTTRLVFLPEYEQIPLRQPVTNAEDVELVVARHRLVVEVSDQRSRSISWIDAYSGELVRRGAASFDTTVRLTGPLYGNVELDATDGGVFRDPVRYALIDDEGRPVQGQGVITALPLMAHAPTYTYRGIAGSDPTMIDASFALQQSWNYYQHTFGRWGLRNLAPSSTSTFNEAVLFVDPTRTTYNSSMEAFVDGMSLFPAARGIIVLNGGNPFWRSLATLDVIGHEWTHGVFSSEVAAPIVFYTGEEGGLDEANSDFFGILIRNRGRQVLANGAADTGVLLTVPDLPNQPASWVYGAEHSQAQPVNIKNLCRPSANASPTVEVWSPTVNSMEAHRAAGPMHRVFCLLSRGIAPLKATGVDPNLQVPEIPNGFPGLGSNTVAQLWYTSLPTLGALADPILFVHARHAMLHSAEAAFGLGSTQYKAIEDAFAAVRVGAPSDHEAPHVEVPVRRVRPGGPLDVIATDSDGVSSLSFFFDGGTPFVTRSSPPPVPLPGPHSVTVPANLASGPKTLTIVAKDIHANQASYDFPLLIDGDGPTLTVTDKTATLGAGPNATVRVFGFTAGDSAGIRSVRVLVDGLESLYPSAHNAGLGGPTTYTYPPPELGGPTLVNEPSQWLVLQEVGAGAHTIVLEATDYAGNVTRASLPDFVRDQLAPGPCTITIARTPLWNQINVIVSAADVGSGIGSVKYFVDGKLQYADKTFVTLTPRPLTVRQPASGTHAFRAECTDQQGNTAVSNTLNVALSPPPECQVVAAATDPVNTHLLNMSMTARSPAASLRSVLYEVNGVVVASELNLTHGPGVAFSKVRQASLSAGTYTVRARCKDSLGQESLSNTVTVNHQPSTAPPTAPTCSSVVHSGANQPQIFTIDVKKTSGVVDFSFDTLDVHDTLTLFCDGAGTINGQPYASTGCIASDGWQMHPDIPFNCATGRIKVQVDPNCAGPGDTVWHFELGCAR